MDENSSTKSGEWSINGPFGADLWRCDGDGGFTHVRVAGASEELVVGKGDIDATGYVHAVCACDAGRGGVFPRGFNFCPQCGMETEKLTAAGVWQMSIPNGGARSTPPYEDHSRISLAETSGLDGAGNAVITSQRTIADLPAGKNFAFLQPREGKSLFALARDLGGLWRLSRSSGQWSHIAKTPEAGSFLGGAWTAVVDDDLVIFPADTEIVAFAFKDGAVKRLDVSPESMKPLSGAARQSKNVVIPVLKKGHPVLFFADLSGESIDGKFIEIQGVPANLTALGRPIETVWGVFWPGKEGYVCFPDGSQSGFWKYWMPEFTPLLNQESYISKDKIAYQIGVLGTSFAFSRFSASQNARQEVHPVDGAMLTAGMLACKGDRRFIDPPWSGRTQLDCIYMINADQFICPILLLNEEQAIVAIVEDRGSISMLARGDEEAFGSLRAEIAFTPDRHSIVRLGKVADLRSMSEFSVFVFDNRLWVYGKDRNELHSWQLK